MTKRTLAQLRTEIEELREQKAKAEAQRDAALGALRSILRTIDSILEATE